MTINIKKLEKLLKIKMQNIFLLDEALTHKSANLEKNNN